MSNELPTPNQSGEHGDLPALTCYECQSLIEIEAAYCPQCGAALEPEDDPYGEVESRVLAFLRKQGRELIRNPLGFFIHWGIYVFVFALGVAIFRGCVEDAVRTITGS